MIPDPIIWTDDDYIYSLNMKEKLKRLDMKIEEANRDDAN